MDVTVTEARRLLHVAGNVLTSTTLIRYTASASVTNFIVPGSTFDRKFLVELTADDGEGDAFAVNTAESRFVGANLACTPTRRAQLLATSPVFHPFAMVAD